MFPGSLSNVIRRSLFAVFALSCVAVAAGPNFARAEHDTFVYHGGPYRSAAEEAMLDALRSIQRAQSSPYGREQLVNRSLNRIDRAMHLVTRPRTHNYLESAHEHLDHFLENGRRSELNLAAALVAKAVNYEQRFTVNHIPHHHHDHGHVVTPVPSRITAPVPGLSVGGNWGRVNVRF